MMSGLYNMYLSMKAKGEFTDSWSQFLKSRVFVNRGLRERGK